MVVFPCTKNTTEESFFEIPKENELTKNKSVKQKEYVVYRQYENIVEN